MTADPEIVLSIRCLLTDSDVVGFLNVSSRPADYSGRLYCVGSVGLVWPVEAAKKAESVFVPPDDSEYVVALMTRRTQQYPQFLAAMMSNGGSFE
jgi:hypothetical protein